MKSKKLISTLIATATVAGVGLFSANSVSALEMTEINSFGNELAIAIQEDVFFNRKKAIEKVGTTLSRFYSRLSARDRGRVNERFFEELQEKIFLLDGKEPSLKEMEELLNRFYVLLHQYDARAELATLQQLKGFLSEQAAQERQEENRRREAEREAVLQRQRIEAQRREEEIRRREEAERIRRERVEEARRREEARRQEVENQRRRESEIARQREQEEQQRREERNRQWRFRQQQQAINENYQRVQRLKAGLNRFSVAQNQGVDGSTIAQAFSELQHGQKTSHWMWYVFPQIKGLGTSAIAQKYAIANAEEAIYYLRNETLHANLYRAIEFALQIPGKSALEIFGSPDDLKLHSSLTLFYLAAGQRQTDTGMKRLTKQALDRFFGGRLDPATQRIFASKPAFVHPF